MRREDLVALHFAPGMWIRNELGLWKGNVALARATGDLDHDGAAMIILEATWRRLHGLSEELLPPPPGSRGLLTDPVCK